MEAIFSKHKHFINFQTTYLKSQKTNEYLTRRTQNILRFFRLYLNAILISLPLLYLPCHLYNELNYILQYFTYNAFFRVYFETVYNVCR